MSRRLVVVDGADQGQFFPLPESGTVSVGNSRRHCDICLHDLYVARVHCHIEIKDNQVLVHASDTPAGLLVKGAKVAELTMNLGDEFRVGNSTLRLETDDGSGMPAKAEAEPEEPAKPAVLPLERLGELSGDVLGHYQLEDVLGQGHYGVVFRATDLKKKESVAFKVLGPTFPAGDAETQRFIKVIKPYLQLHHPNLVALLAVGKTGPYTWLAQELVEGEDMTSVLAYLRTAQKIKWRRAWRVAVGLARMLTFFHERHLVHGNITPQNIILQTIDGQPRVNGFFLPRAVEGSKLQKAVLEKKILAELPYLAPEQTDPEGKPDDLSDQYSAGVIVYALLTGRPPFEAQKPEELVERIRFRAPLNPQHYQRSIPDELKAIVLKMLAKHPEERYATPAELLEELEQFAEHEETV
jgi:serine/threonine protein kinase